MLRSSFTKQFRNAGVQEKGVHGSGTDYLSCSPFNVKPMQFVLCRQHRRAADNQAVLTRRCVPSSCSASQWQITVFHCDNSSINCSFKPSNIKLKSFLFRPLLWTTTAGVCTFIPRDPTTNDTTSASPPCMALVSCTVRL